MSYVKPEDVWSPQERLSYVEVLYDGGECGYSLARLVWDGDECIGIRYNGTDSEPNGYPSSRGYPQWIVLYDEAIKIITAYKLGLLPKYNSNTDIPEKNL